MYVACVLYSCRQFHVLCCSPSFVVDDHQGFWWKWDTKTDNRAAPEWDEWALISKRHCEIVVACERCAFSRNVRTLRYFRDSPSLMTITIVHTLRKFLPNTQNIVTLFLSLTLFTAGLDSQLSTRDYESRWCRWESSALLCVRFISFSFFSFTPMVLPLLAHTCRHGIRWRITRTFLTRLWHMTSHAIALRSSHTRPLPSILLLSTAVNGSCIEGIWCVIA